MKDGNGVRVSERNYVFAGTANENAAKRGYQKDESGKPFREADIIR